MDEPLSDAADPGAPPGLWTRARQGLGWIFGLGALVGLAWDFRTPAHPVDDAYISFRYAANWVHGHGLVYNPGEYVEGFTNLLWTLLIGAGMRLGGEPERIAELLAAVSGGATLLLCALYARRTLPEAQRWLFGLAPCLVLSSAPFAAWVNSGLETPLFAALTLGALLCAHEARMGWAVVVLVLATLTRPDGVVVAAAVLAVHAWRTRAEPWRALGPSAAFAAALLALTLWRLAYYGEALPNTFYAKVGGIPILRGMAYTIGFLLDGPLIAIALMLPGVRRAENAAPLLYLLLTVIYVVSIGGDVFPHGRFLLPALACLAVMSVQGVALLARRHAGAGAAGALGLASWLAWSQLGALAAPALAGAAALGILILVASRVRPARIWLPPALALGFSLVVAFPPALHDIQRAVSNPNRRSRAEIVKNLARVNAGSCAINRALARRLRAERPPPRLIAAIGIGCLGYYSELPILDLVGLVDPIIAHSDGDATGGILLPGHQRSNADYVLARMPDVVFAPASVSAALPAVRDLLDHPDFRAHYVADPGIKGFRLVPRRPEDPPARPSGASRPNR